MGTESEAGWALFLPIGCERGGEAELPVGRTEAPVGCEAGVRGHGGPRAGSGGGAGAGGGPWCGGERAGGGAGPNDRRAWEGPEGGGEGTGPGLGSPEGGGGGTPGLGDPSRYGGRKPWRYLCCTTCLVVPGGQGRTLPFPPWKWAAVSDASPASRRSEEGVSAPPSPLLPPRDLHAAVFASVESFGKLQGLKLCCLTELTHIVKLG